MRATRSTNKLAGYLSPEELARNSCCDGTDPAYLKYIKINDVIGE